MRGIILLVAACVLSCAQPRADSSAAVATIDERPVVRRASFAQRFLMTGELKAVEAVSIFAPQTRTGNLTIRWLEQDGAEVEAGQTVLEFDNSQFSGDLEQKRLSEQKASNDLDEKRAEIAVQLADKAFAVEQARLGVEKAAIEAAVPAELLERREYRERRLALQRAKSIHEKAQADLASYERSSRAELEVMRIALEKTRGEIAEAERAIDQLAVRAPGDGILVVNTNWREGRKLQVGDSLWGGQPAMRIPNLERMMVEATLSDVDDGRLVPGLPARVTLDTYPEQRYAGRVREIAPIAQETRRQSLRRGFRVTVELDATNPERMRPGMSARVEVTVGARDDVLLIPRRALDLSGDAPRAVLADGRRVELTLGACNARDCVVEEGPAEGTALRFDG